MIIAAVGPRRRFQVRPRGKHDLPKQPDFRGVGGARCSGAGRPPATGSRASIVAAGRRDVGGFGDGSLVATSDPCGKVHQGVGSLMEEVLSIFVLDVPLICVLQPDLILTQKRLENAFESSLAA